MVNICHNMADTADYGEINYVLKASIAGFEKGTETMSAQGIV